MLHEETKFVFFLLFKFLVEGFSLCVTWAMDIKSNPYNLVEMAVNVAYIIKKQS